MADAPHILVIEARFYEDLADELVAGAEAAIAAAGATCERVTVPGAFEIPGAVRIAMECERFDGYVALGVVIRGETTHDVHINTTVSAQLGQLMMESGKPVAFGVLTCNNLEQAIQRSGGSVGNKGCEAVDSAVEMLRLIDRAATE